MSSGLVTVDPYTWLASGSTSASRVSVATTLCDASHWPAGCENHAELCSAVLTAGEASLRPGLGAGSPDPPRRDPRAAAWDVTRADGILSVFTDSATVRENLTSPRFKLVADEAEADVLFIVRHVKKFLEVGVKKVVSQFPYEGGLVCKDLLPQTVRRACFTQVSDKWVAPRWWSPCFDLATETHFFVAEFKRRVAAKEPNTWIVKAARSSHAINYTITRDARCVCALMRDRPGGVDQVAQLYVERPLTLRGRKFDLRIFVLVRSFGPDFEGYIHPYVHARLAAKPWDGSADASLDFRGMHFTTAPGSGVGEFPHVGPEELESELRSEGMSPEQWQSILSDCERSLCELFIKSAPQIGAWPRSRGYYGCDVILERSLDAPDLTTEVVPRLLEVNFQADLEIVGLTSGKEAMRRVVNDIFDTLFTDEIPANLKPMKLDE